MDPSLQQMKDPLTLQTVSEKNTLEYVDKYLKKDKVIYTEKYRNIIKFHRTEILKLINQIKKGEVKYHEFLSRIYKPYKPVKLNIDNVKKYMGAFERLAKDDYTYIEYLDGTKEPILHDVKEDTKLLKSKEYKTFEKKYPGVIKKLIENEKERQRYLKELEPKNGAGSVHITDTAYNRLKSEDAIKINELMSKFEHNIPKDSLIHTNYIFDQTEGGDKYRRFSQGKYRFMGGWKPYDPSHLLFQRDWVLPDVTIEMPVDPKTGKRSYLGGNLPNKKDWQLGNVHEQWFKTEMTSAIHKEYNQRWLELLGENSIYGKEIKKHYSTIDYQDALKIGYMDDLWWVGKPQDDYARKRKLTPRKLRGVDKFLTGLVSFKQSPFYGADYGNFFNDYGTLDIAPDIMGKPTIDMDAAPDLTPDAKRYAVARNLNDIDLLDTKEYKDFLKTNADEIKIELRNHPIKTIKKPTPEATDVGFDLETAEEAKARRFQEKVQQAATEARDMTPEESARNREELRALNQNRFESVTEDVLTSKAEANNVKRLLKAEDFKAVVETEANAFRAWKKGQKTWVLWNADIFTTNEIAKLWGINTKERSIIQRGREGERLKGIEKDLFDRYNDAWDEGEQLKRLNKWKVDRQTLMPNEPFYKTFDKSDELLQVMLDEQYIERQLSGDVQRMPRPGMTRPTRTENIQAAINEVISKLEDTQAKTTNLERSIQEAQAAEDIIVQEATTETRAKVPVTQDERFKIKPPAAGRVIMPGEYSIQPHVIDDWHAAQASSDSFFHRGNPIRLVPRLAREAKSKLANSIQAFRARAGPAITDSYIGDVGRAVRRTPDFVRNPFSALPDVPKPLAQSVQTGIESARMSRMGYARQVASAQFAAPTAGVRWAFSEGTAARPGGFRLLGAAEGGLVTEDIGQDIARHYGGEATELTPTGQVVAATPGVAFAYKNPLVAASAYSGRRVGEKFAPAIEEKYGIDEDVTTNVATVAGAIAGRTGVGAIVPIGADIGISALDWWDPIPEGSLGPLGV